MSVRVTDNDATVPETANVGDIVREVGDRVYQEAVGEIVIVIEWPSASY